jgi:hypothetical protein
VTEASSGDKSGRPEAHGPREEASARPSAPRAAFAADWPRDPALDAALAEFEAGNFARVREDVPRILSSNKDEAVKSAAAALLTRTRPDPLATLLLVLSAVLLVLLSGWWIVHSGGGAHKS